MQSVKAARAQDMIVWLELYCDNSACPVRTITVHVKDYDRDLRDDQVFYCPMCRRQTKIHGAFTRQEHFALSEGLR